MTRLEEFEFAIEVAAKQLTAWRSRLASAQSADDIVYSEKCHARINVWMRFYEVAVNDRNRYLIERLGEGVQNEG